MNAAEGGLNLGDARVVGAAERINALQQVELALHRHVGAGHLHGVQVMRRRLRALDGHAGGRRAALGDLPRRAGRRFQAGNGYLVRKGVTRLLAR